MDKQFRHSPEVRAYLAKVKRDYRARKKQKVGVNAAKHTTPTNKNPHEDHSNLTEVLAN